MKLGIQCVEIGHVGIDRVEMSRVEMSRVEIDCVEIDCVGIDLAIELVIDQASEHYNEARYTA